MSDGQNNPRAMHDSKLPSKPDAPFAPCPGSASMFDSLEPSEIHALYIVMDAFKALAKCRRTIGNTEVGQHPDEINPRAETWMKERLNWETEVEMLRKRVSELEARPNNAISQPRAL